MAAATLSAALAWITAGDSLADEAAANKLFVATVQQLGSITDALPAEERAAKLADVLAALDRILAEEPESSIAKRLAADGKVGRIDRPAIAAALAKAQEELATAALQVVTELYTSVGTAPDAAAAAALIDRAIAKLTAVEGSFPASPSAQRLRAGGEVMGLSRGALAQARADVAAVPFLRELERSRSDHAAAATPEARATAAEAGLAALDALVAQAPETSLAVQAITGLPVAGATREELAGRAVAARLEIARAALDAAERSSDAEELRRQADAARQTLERLVVSYPESEPAKAWAAGRPVAGIERAGLNRLAQDAPALARLRRLSAQLRQPGTPDARARLETWRKALAEWDAIIDDYPETSVAAEMAAGLPAADLTREAIVAGAAEAELRVLKERLDQVPDAAPATERVRRLLEIEATGTTLQERYPDAPAVAALARGEEVQGLSLGALRALIEDAPARDELRALTAQIDALRATPAEVAPAAFQATLEAWDALVAAYGQSSPAIAALQRGGSVAGTTRQQLEEGAANATAGQIRAAWLAARAEADIGRRLDRLHELRAALDGFAARYPRTAAGADARNGGSLAGVERAAIDQAIADAPAEAPALELTRQVAAALGSDPPDPNLHAQALATWDRFVADHPGSTVARRAAAGEALAGASRAELARRLALRRWELASERWEAVGGRRDYAAALPGLDELDVAVAAMLADAPEEPLFDRIAQGKEQGPTPEAIAARKRDFAAWAALGEVERLTAQAEATGEAAAKITAFDKALAELGRVAPQHAAASFIADGSLTRTIKVKRDEAAATPKLAAARAAIRDGRATATLEQKTKLYAGAATLLREVVSQQPDTAAAGSLRAGEAFEGVRLDELGDLALRESLDSEQPELRRAAILAAAVGPSLELARRALDLTFDPERGSPPAGKAAAAQVGPELTSAVTDAVLAKGTDEARAELGDRVLGGSDAKLAGQVLAGFTSASPDLRRELVRRCTAGRVNICRAALLGSWKAEQVSRGELGWIQITTADAVLATGDRCLVRLDGPVSQAGERLVFALRGRVEGDCYLTHAVVRVVDADRLEVASDRGVEWANRRLDRNPATMTRIFDVNGAGHYWVGAALWKRLSYPVALWLPPVEKLAKVALGDYIGVGHYSQFGPCWRQLYLREAKKASFHLREEPSNEVCWRTTGLKLTPQPNGTLRAEWEGTNETPAPSAVLQRP